MAICLNCGNTVNINKHRFPVCSCGCTELLEDDLYAVINEIETYNIDIRSKSQDIVVEKIDTFETFCKYFADIPILDAKNITDSLNMSINDSEREFIATLDKSCHIIKHYYMYRFVPEYFAIVNVPKLWKMAKAILESKYIFPDIVSITPHEKNHHATPSELPAVLNSLQDMSTILSGEGLRIAYDYLTSNFNEFDIIRYAKNGITLKMLVNICRLNFPIEKINNYINESGKQGFYGKDIMELIYKFNTLLKQFHSMYAEGSIHIDLTDNLYQNNFILEFVIRMGICNGSKQQKELIENMMSYQGPTKFQIDKDTYLHIMPIDNPEKLQNVQGLFPWRDNMTQPIFEFVRDYKLISYIIFGKEKIYSSNQLSDEDKILLNTFMDNCDMFKE